MAAQLRNIIVTVIDDSGDPLQNATVTLMGGNNPQVRATDQTGQCTFQTLPAGRYRLLVSQEGFNTRALIVNHTDLADSQVRAEMKVVDEGTTSEKSRTFFRILTGLQYLFLAGLALVFAIVLIRGIKVDMDLSNKEAARGLITFVVSVVTVAIGLFLVVGAAFMSGSKDLEKRFTFGKDVFTVLVGVLGTVMGFYYGQAGAGGAGGNANGNVNANANANANTQQQAAQGLQISAPQVNPAAPRINTEFTVTANVSGGEGPFIYTVTFDNPNAITTPAQNVTSDTANINRKFTLANTAAAGQPIGFTINATDKNQKKGTSAKATFTPSP